MADLGARPDDINKGEAVVIIGKKGVEKGRAIYKSTDKHEKSLKLKRKIKNTDIKVEINFANKLLEIKIDDSNYPFYYSIAAGNMVILDGDSLELKFYQTRGYTARKEDIKSILKGKEYIKKGPQGEVPKMSEQHISSYHPDSFMVKKLLETARG